jgi:hypothetical protein
MTEQTNAPLSSQRLEDIRIADEAAGDLQMCPETWLHRRELLQHIDALEQVAADQARLTRELDVLLNGEQGAARQPSLCDIVAQLSRMNHHYVVAARLAEVQRVLPPTTCGYCRYEEADGELLEQCENCKAKDAAKVST